MSTKRQLINTIMIVIGAGLLLFDLITQNQNVYIKIAGLVILMFGLYTATRRWVTDNKTNEDEDDKIE